MTGKKTIQKILKQSVQDIDKIHSRVIDYMDTGTKEFDLINDIIHNVRQNLSFLEIDLSNDIKRINEKSRWEKQYKTAVNKVGKLNLNFLNQPLKYNKMKRYILKNPILI